MKSLNGILFVMIGGAIIWIGATGRLPALAAALGMVRSAPGNGGTTTQNGNPFADGVSKSSTVSGATSAAVPQRTASDMATNFWNNTVGPYAYVLGLK